MSRGTSLSHALSEAADGMHFPSAVTKIFSPRSVCDESVLVPPVTMGKPSAKRLRICNV